MDEDGDWITARYLLSSVLGRNPLVVDYVDEESFPVDSPARCSPPAPALPPAVPATAAVAGTVCAVCTEEIAAADTVMRLPCAHWYHAGCISPWLGIKNACPLCRAELPRDEDAGCGDAGGEKPRTRSRAAAETSGGASSYEFLASGVLSS